MKLVIGVGNINRGDDGLGAYVAKRLLEQIGPEVRVVTHLGGADLFELWSQADSVIIVDAVSSGAEPGMVHRLDANDGPLPSNLFASSTHALGVSEAVELARVLDRMPQKMIIFGVEAKQFSPGVGISPELEPAIEHVVERVIEEVAHA
jgi:hydrogenase maturation protease